MNNDNLSRVQVAASVLQAELRLAITAARNGQEIQAAISAADAVMDSEMRAWVTGRQHQTMLAEIRGAMHDPEQARAPERRSVMAAFW